jgi:CRP-like cAMP-binding protein
MITLCILDDSLKKVTAVALEDVLLAIITQKTLYKLITTNPGSGAKLLKGMLLTVSDRLRKSFDRIVTSSDLYSLVDSLDYSECICPCFIKSYHER